MQSIKKELKSGNFLEIQAASFDECFDLFQALGKCLKEVNIDINNIDINSEIDFNILNTFKNLFFSIIGSKDLKNALNRCFKKCLYDNQKINDELFDINIGAREDYFIICFEVLKFNLAPFIKGVDLKSLTSLLPRKNIGNQG